MICYADEDEADPDMPGLPSDSDSDDEDDLRAVGRPRGGVGRKRLSAPRSCTAKRQAIVDESDNESDPGGKDAASDDDEEIITTVGAAPAPKVPSWPSCAQRQRSSGSASLSRAASGVTPRAATGSAAGESSNSALSWGSGRKRGSGALRSSPLGAPERRRAAKKLRIDFETRAQELGMTLNEVEDVASQERAAFAEGDAVEDVRCVVRSPF